MSLLGIVIVGKKNEPLYLCDCTKVPNHEEDEAAAATTLQQVSAVSNGTTALNDPFGFLQPASTAQGQSLEMEQQFIVHAALDRLEEQVGASKPDGTMPLRKAVRSVNASTPSTPSKKSSFRALGHPTGQWLGLLTVQDGSSAVYGYVTATNIKFLILLEHPSGATNGETRELLQEQTKAVHTLCTTLHAHYITYLLNPFQPLYESRLESASLDRNIRHAVRTFRESQIVSV